MRDYSITIFGSSTRKDFDKYSDKDLLIVADDISHLEKLKKEYQKEGWSVSSYTYSKLSYISKIGGLFIEHLKNEGEIIRDDNNKLETILNSHISKNNYDIELKETKEFFNILTKIPKRTISYAWFCDTFFVGLRNYLIYENANNRMYEFSYIGLLNNLYNKKRISKLDFNLLKELRVIKRNYREGIKDELPSIEYIYKIYEIARKLGFLSELNIQPIDEYQKHIENNLLTSGFTPYQKLRLIESYYLTKDTIIPKLKKIISNPQFYACKMKDDKYTLELINAINTGKNNTQQTINKAFWVRGSLASSSVN